MTHHQPARPPPPHPTPLPFNSSRSRPDMQISWVVRGVGAGTRLAIRCAIGETNRCQPPCRRFRNLSLYHESTTDRASNLIKILTGNNETGSIDVDLVSESQWKVDKNRSMPDRNLSYLISQGKARFVKFNGESGRIWMISVKLKVISPTQPS